MVTITIYVEGATMLNNSAAAQTVNNNAAFREGFHRLFSQKLKPNDFKLVVQPIGSVSQAKKYLQKILDEETNDVVLIDLDAPKSQKEERLKRYTESERSILFFMIQEMESWILSQPHILDEYAQQERFNRKRQGEHIKNNALIRNKHPEELTKPSTKLNELFRQYFEVEKKKSRKMKPRGYNKKKDGPKLIGLLKLDVLMGQFDEAANLVARLTSQKG